MSRCYPSLKLLHRLNTFLPRYSNSGIQCSVGLAWPTPNIYRRSLRVTTRANFSLTDLPFHLIPSDLHLFTSNNFTPGMFEALPSSLTPVAELHPNALQKTQTSRTPTGLNIPRVATTFTATMNKPVYRSARFSSQQRYARSLEHR